jgi:general secretion pathway protein G
MKARSNRMVASNTGFTLIEVLMVLVITVFVIGLLVGAAGFANRKAALSRTRTEIATIEQALEAFKADKGYYPTNGIANVYNGLTQGTKKYMGFRSDQLSGTSIIDPFGLPYVYVCPGMTNQAGFDLYSNGPDRTAGTVDDITNWGK